MGLNGKIIRDARHVLLMLERLSADSRWAHKASGLRGSILHAIDHVEANPHNPKSLAALDDLVQKGYDILKKAAAEIRGLE